MFSKLQSKQSIPITGDVVILNMLTTRPFREIFRSEKEEAGPGGVDMKEKSRKESAANHIVWINRVL